MSKWKATITPKSDQLNADDLIGGDMVITVSRVLVNESSDQPASIFYKGDNGKPYKPCKTMRRVIAHCWGLDEENYVGRSLHLYRDESVKWAGDAVGGIRIKAMSHINERKRISLQVSKGKRMPVTIDMLAVNDKPDNKRQNAQEWANSISAILDAQEYEQEFMQVWNTNNEKIERLKKYPEIYEQLTAIYETKVVQFNNEEDLQNQENGIFDGVDYGNKNENKGE